MGFVKDQHSIADVNGHGFSDDRVDEVVVGAKYQLGLACKDIHLTYVHAKHRHDSKHNESQMYTSATLQDCMPRLPTYIFTGWYFGKIGAKGSWLKANGSTCKIARCKVRAGPDILADTHKVLDVMHLSRQLFRSLDGITFDLLYAPSAAVVMTFAVAAR